MRIRRVKAIAFGALQDKELCLSDGLNVVVGPNDSGKSTWHAALFAALCGYPLTPDPASAEQAAADRRFRRQREPRRLDGWSVEAEIELENDHRLVVGQNLLRPETSTVSIANGAPAMDGLPALRYEGGIDTSRLLGLTRRSYAATAWVPQDRARLIDEETGTEELQRIVRDYLGEAEAAQGCDRIRDFRRDRIGSDTDTFRPLGWAVSQNARRQQELDQARLREQSRAEAAQEVQRAQAQLAEVQHKLRVAEALAAKAKVKHVADDIKRLRAQAHDLQTQIAQLRGSYIAVNAQASTAVYKFPGYIDKGDSTVDRDGRAAGPSLGHDPADPFRKLAPEPEPRPEPEPAPRHRFIFDEPVELPKFDANRDPHVGVARPPRDLGAIEGLLFPFLFFGGLVLAALGLIVAISLGSVLGVVIAVLATLPALGGLALRFIVRRDRTRRELVAAEERAARETAEEKTAEDETAAQETADIFDKPADVEQLSAGEYWTPEPEPIVEEVPDDRLDEEIRYLENQLAERERQLLLMEQEYVQAEDEARRQAQGINPYELYAWDDTMDAALRAREQAHDAVSEATRQVAGAEQHVANLHRTLPQFPTLADAQASLAEGQREVARLREQDRLLAETLDQLVAARFAARGRITDGIETRLRDYLPEVTRNKHSIVDVDNALRVRIGDQSQPMDDPTPGSRGTVEQAHLLRLIALGRHLGYGHEAGPLLLDDVTSNADGPRMRRILELLHRIAEQRQVVVFAHEKAVEKWARRVQGTDSRLRLHVLTSVNAAPAANPRPARPTRQPRKSG